MQHLRLDHDPQRQLLQVRELWDDLRLRVTRLEGLRNKAEGLVQELGKKMWGGPLRPAFSFPANPSPEPPQFSEGRSIESITSTGTIVFSRSSFSPSCSCSAVKNSGASTSAGRLSVGASPGREKFSSSS